MNRRSFMKITGLSALLSAIGLNAKEKEDIIFPLGDDDYGTVTHAALFDSPNGNNIFDNSSKDLYIGLFSIPHYEAVEEDYKGNEISGAWYMRNYVSLAFDKDSGCFYNPHSLNWVVGMDKGEDVNYKVVTHIALFDSPNDGNMLFYSDLSSLKSIYTGDTFKIATGDLNINLT